MRQRLPQLLLLLVGTAAALLLLEAGSRWIVRRSHVPTLEEIDFYAAHVRGIHHLRDLDGKWDTRADPTRYLHTVHVPFAGRRDRLLIQGDSWAEALALAAGLPAALARHGLGELGVVNAGTTSYSPSPMTLQLRRLREEHAMRPTRIVALIDQTDVGDEACRYAPAWLRDLDGRLLWLRPSPSLERSHYPAEHRLLQLRYLRLEPIKSLALLNHLLLRDRILPVAYGRARGCGWKDIRRYLEGGDTAGTEAGLFREALRGYLDEAFADPALDRVLLVTHPHELHLRGHYVRDVADLVREVLARHPARDRIRHLDFRRHFDEVYAGRELGAVFVTGDIGSHLREEHYRGAFRDRILAAVAAPPAPE